jgi:GNAT superfamily N-acetyltransferase
MNEIVIARLTPADQPAARALILAGLEEHWGWLDPSLNPGLDNILTSYANGTFLVAKIDGEDGELVGTGALMPVADGVARIVRMSVARAHRWSGVGTRILRALLDEARAQGIHNIVLETTETWDDAISFYLRNGFRLTHHADGDAHFEMKF